MWIDEWIFKEGITKAEFARRVGISRVYLTSIISGRKRGSPDVAKRIRDMTNGEVTFEDILLGDRTKRKIPPKERK